MLFSLLGAILSNLTYLILHVTGTGSFPRPLTAQEERDCLRQMRGGDRSAREKLIEHNLRLVAHIVKKYYAGQNDQDDLISIGTIGLIKAIDSFDCEKGIRLSSYAARCIENAILSQTRQQKSGDERHRTKSRGTGLIRLAPLLSFLPFR